MSLFSCIDKGKEARLQGMWVRGRRISIARQRRKAVCVKHTTERTLRTHTPILGLTVDSCKPVQIVGVPSPEKGGLRGLSVRKVCLKLRSEHISKRKITTGEGIMEGGLTIKKSNQKQLALEYL